MPRNRPEAWCCLTTPAPSPCSRAWQAVVEASAAGSATTAPTRAPTISTTRCLSRCSSAATGPPTRRSTCAPSPTRSTPTSPSTSRASARCCEYQQTNISIKSLEEARNSYNSRCKFVKQTIKYLL